MKIKNVRIHAFGPFSDQTLEFAGGMTIISGDNESGKSAWHAAIHAALCGMRRGPGQAKEDRDFREQHRPWGGNTWCVEANLDLADGRQIGIIQDLDGVDRRAVDRGLGRRDVSAEIMFEQSPDATRWLGLDRRTFRATACVRQTEILEVVNSADALQEHLQRAAATGGSDQTAARALQLVNDFQSEHVGTLRAWTKPLHVTGGREIAARRNLDQANREHEIYLDKFKTVQQLKVDAEEVEKRCRLLAAANSLRLAEQAQHIADRIRTLIGELNSEPIDAETLQAAMGHISQAVAVWNSAPVSEPGIGRTSAEIERELAALSKLPGSDLSPSQSVLQAEQAWLVAKTALSELEEQRPEPPAAPRASISLLIASLLIAAGVIAVTEVSAEFLRPTYLVTILTLLFAGSLALLAIRNIFVFKVRAQTASQAWNTSRARLRQVLGEKDAALRTALIQRGVANVNDVEMATQAYREGCERRSTVAVLKREREHVLLVEDNIAKHNAAREKLLQAAHDQHLEAIDPQSALEALRQWQETTRERLAEAHRQASAAGELKSLLGGRAPEQFVEDVEIARQNAEELIGDLPRSQVEVEAATPGLGDRLAEAQRAASKAKENRAKAEGELNALKVPNVSACEEALAIARAELDRVHRLDATLKTTRRFLEDAQDRVHREFAPYLEQALCEWLPSITNNRYTDANVDPISLNVTVKEVGGTFREARLLSQGTREQIYLLLRIALVDFLTKPGEVSPLIFDDVMVQTDGVRTDAVLDLLHEMSRTRQVIVFSQEDDVHRWAERHLAENEHDKLVRLKSPIGVG